ncbi:MAG: hypothetical protein H7Y03_00575 [Chitinophagaceae bacterium]|nr:hypothetical protein [Chitinophagaceae bacterium]
MVHIKNRIRIAVIGLALLSASVANAQMIDSMMNIYSTKFPQEKMHVHFDKSYYNPGETIWFKAYIMNGVFPSEISRNFYAELIDDDGTVIQRRVAPIAAGSAASSFDIPASFKGAAVHFRAYTTWMLNFDEAFLYEKNIRIVSAQASKKAPPAAVNSLRFFPEGGDLVNNVPCTLAFKANDAYGRPVTVKGQIVGNGAKKVADFASTHNGMGTLSITPLKGESYKAIWKDASGAEQSIPIPAARETGVVMHLTPDNGAVLFSLRKSSADSAALKRLVIIGHMNQQLVYKAKINFAAASSVVNGSIPTDQFPTGILQVTLFDDRERPLQERITFVNNNDYVFDAYLSPSSKKFTKRAKNVFEVEIPDTVMSNLSVSITDADINIPNDNDDNIYSRLLLSGDIKGYVYNAGYYFSSFADSISRQLDLVMLTNGWRRFNWEELAKGKEYPIKFAPEDYLTVQGAINGIDPSRLPTGTSLNIIMQFKDSSRQILSAPVDRNGKFNITGLLFYDTADFYYQFNNNKTLADRISLVVDNGFRQKSLIAALPSSTNMDASYLIDSAVARNKRIVQQYSQLEAERAKKARVLEEVVVRGRVRTNIDKLDEKYASGIFRGGDGYSFDLINDPFAVSSLSVFQYLQGKVAGLQISNGQSGTPTLTWRGGAPGLYLDEIQQQDAQSVANIPMSDIAYIKVFRPPFIGGFGGGNGAIVIYTKKGGDQPQDNSFKGLKIMKLSGYSPVKEFYVPNYAEYNPEQELNDLRTTLHWSPFVFLDKDKKKATINFYNSDITKKFRVVIEGVNINGKLTRVEEIIQ